jgi:hypothetical protein
VKKKPEATAKEFENIVGKRLEEAEIRGDILRAYRIPDGATMVPFGNTLKHVHTTTTPSDFFGYCMSPDGCAFPFLVEAKKCEGKSLSVQPTERRWAQRVAANPSMKQTKYSASPGALRRHQLEALVDVENAGGRGLLVVYWVATGQVIAIDGTALAAWDGGDDEGGNIESISMKHFQTHGMLLSTNSGPRAWAFNSTCFQKG